MIDRFVLKQLMDCINSHFYLSFDILKNDLKQIVSTKPPTKLQSKNAKND